MFILVLIFQAFVAILLPVVLIDNQYRKSGEIKRKWVWVFAALNFIVIAILNVTLLYPDSVNDKYWWIVDAGVFVLPCIANSIVKNGYPVFDKSAVAEKMGMSEKENMLETISEGIIKCCEEMRNQPNDLHDFLAEQTKTGILTELQATLLWEKYSGEKRS